MIFKPASVRLAQDGPALASIPVPSYAGTNAWTASIEDLGATRPEPSQSQDRFSGLVGSPTPARLKLNVQIQRLRIDGLQPHHELRFATALRSELERLANGPDGTRLRSQLRIGSIDPLRLRRLRPSNNHSVSNDPIQLGKATANAIFQELMP